MKSLTVLIAIQSSEDGSIAMALCASQLASDTNKLFGTRPLVRSPPVMMPPTNWKIAIAFRNVIAIKMGSQKPGLKIHAQYSMLKIFLKDMLAFRRTDGLSVVVS